MRETCERSRESYSPELMTLLESRLEKCQRGLDRLQQDLDRLDPSLVPAHETLVSVLRSTAAVNTRSKVPTLKLTVERRADQRSSPRPR